MIVLNLEIYKIIIVLVRNIFVLVSIIPNYYLFNFIIIMIINLLFTLINFIFLINIFIKFHLILQFYFLIQFRFDFFHLIAKQTLFNSFHCLISFNLITNYNSFLLVKVYFHDLFLIINIINLIIIYLVKFIIVKLKINYITHLTIFKINFVDSIIILNIINLGFLFINHVMLFKVYTIILYYLDHAYNYIKFLSFFIQIHFFRHEKLVY